MSNQIMTYPEPLDLAKIINLVKQQLPERTDVLKALGNSDRGTWDGKAYYRFISAENANQDGATWQYDECIEIETKNEGTFLIDILKNGTIGGIEFLKYIL